MTSVVIAPHPVLRQTAKEVTRLDKKILTIIRNMTQALLAAKNPEGVGLAAPQIGLPLQIFLARPDPQHPPLVFINPHILDYSQRQQKPTAKKGVYEGCLSIPHHYSPLTRSMSVTVKYQTLSPALSSQTQSRNPLAPENERLSSASLRSGRNDNFSLVNKTETFTGFIAHIIQHEVDHLNGILFIDRVLEQNSKLYKVNHDTWEEVGL